MRADDLDAVDVGQTQVEQDDVGPARVPALQGRSAVDRLLDAVAPRGQLAHQRGPRLVVVLDDEHESGQPVERLRSRRRRDELGRHRRRRQRRCRWPARRARCAARATVPPIASTSPWTTARPMPVPCRDAASCPVPGRTSRTAASRSASGTPCAAVLDGQPDQVVVRRRALISDRRAASACGATAFSITFVNAASRNTGIDARPGVAAGRRRARPPGQRSRREALERADEQIVELERVRPGAQHAGLDPAQVEQVGDQSVEVLDLALDGIDALAFAPRSSRRPPERAGRGADRGQRRAQVVRHGLEQRRLQRVALARHLGGVRLGGEAIVGDRLAQLVGGGGEQPRLRRRWRPERRAAGWPRSIRRRSPPVSISTRKLSSVLAARPSASAADERAPTGRARRRASVGAD